MISAQVTNGWKESTKGWWKMKWYQMLLQSSSRNELFFQGEAVAERKVSFEYMRKIEFDAEEIELQHAHAVATRGNMFSVIKCIFALKGTDGINV